MVGFVWVELRTAQPVVDLGLFRARLFASSGISLTVLFIASRMFQFVFPFFLLQGLEWSSSEAGLVMMSTPLTMLVVSPVAGRIYDKIGSQALASIGLVCVALAYFLLSGLAMDASIASIVPRLALLGFGFGLFESPNSGSILGAVPTRRLGTASAMIGTLRLVGQSTGLAIGGAVFAGGLAYHTIDSPYAEAVSLAFRGTVVVSVAVCAFGALVSALRGREHPGVGPDRA
jgi:MFS family permease